MLVHGNTVTDTKVFLLSVVFNQCFIEIFPWLSWTSGKAKVCFSIGITRKCQGMVYVHNRKEIYESTKTTWSVVSSYLCWNFIEELF